MFIRLLLFFTITFISFHGHSQNTDGKKTNINLKAKELTDSALKLVTIDLGSDKVIDLLNQALQIDSNYLPALYNKFSFEGGLKHYDEAIIIANHILRIQPQNPSLQFSAAMMYFISGDTISSKRYFNEAEIEVNNLLDTMEHTSKTYNDLLLNKAFIMIFKDSLQTSDSILTSLISRSKNNIEIDLYSLYLHKTKEQVINDIFNNSQSTTMDSSDAVPQFEIDTVKFCGQNDIHKYTFEPGFYLLKEDHRKSKGFIVSDTNEYYFIARNITIPLTALDSVSKRFNNRLKKFELIFYFKDSSVKELYDFTAKCLNRKIGILINDKLINAVNVLMPIENGKLSLSGSKLNEQKVNDLKQSIDKIITKQEAKNKGAVYK